LVNKLYLDNCYINNIQQEVSNLNFNYVAQDNQYKDSIFQYVHNVHYDGTPLVNPILEVAKKTLDIKWATRIKVNKLLSQKASVEQVQHLWHQDKVKKGYVSLIYYVNNSDGDTIVGGYKNTPKAGEIIYFDSDLFHRPSLPTKNERIIINFIFEKNK
tara:strand:- start:135 stop:608 length:474 start_codon:yes stop_codon:yes gene_type:complete